MLPILKAVFITALTIVAFASAAFAQDDLVFNISYTEICLEGAKTDADLRQCIGVSADACILATPGGQSTYGMGGCLSFEADWWDGRLNDSYQKLMALEKVDDADMVAEGFDVPNKADALRDMQRAWISFRDATCDYEYSQWGGGTGGGPASISCFMRLTAEQTLYLESARLP